MICLSEEDEDSEEEDWLDEVVQGEEAEDKDPCVVHDDSSNSNTYYI